MLVFLGLWKEEGKRRRRRKVTFLCGDKLQRRGMKKIEFCLNSGKIFFFFPPVYPRPVSEVLELVCVCVCVCFLTLEVRKSGCEGKAGENKRNLTFFSSCRITWQKFFFAAAARWISRRRNGNDLRCGYPSICACACVRVRVRLEKRKAQKLASEVGIVPYSNFILLCACNSH